MGGFGSALQGLGGVANDIATGKMTYQDWQTKQALDKLAVNEAQLRLQSLQNQLKQAGQPEAIGTTKTPDGSTVAILRDPNTGQISTKVLVPGFDAMKIKGLADQTIAGLPESMRSLAQGIYDMYAQTGDPMGGIKALTSLGEKSQTSGKLTKGDYVPDSNSITGYSRQMLNPDGSVAKLIPNVLIPGLVPKETQGWATTTDADGNVIMVPETRVTKPVGAGVSNAGAPKPSAGGSPANGNAPPGSRVIGHKPNKPLDALTQRQINDDTVLLNQIDGYRNMLEGLKNDNTPGFFLKARTAYALGLSGPYSDLINQISRFNVTSMKTLAASRNMRMIDMIQVHLPDFWKDSPALIYQKLGDIEKMLQGDVQVKSPPGNTSDIINDLFDTSKLKPR